MAKLEKRREADFTKKEMIELSGCSSAQDFDYKMKSKRFITRCLEK